MRAKARESAVLIVAGAKRDRKRFEFFRLKKWLRKAFFLAKRSPFFFTRFAADLRVFNLNVILLSILALLLLYQFLEEKQNFTRIAGSE